jgi:small GTP-binding protein
MTDTAGQEQFRSFTSSYFRDKHGALVVFDVSNRASFADLAHWVEEIRKWDENTQLVVVGNKMDLVERKVSLREAEEFAQSVRAEYIETSAKLEINCIKVRVSWCFFSF